MGILTKDDPVRKLRGEVSNLQHKLRIAEADRDAAQAQLEGRKDLMWWVTAKCHRQSSALDDLNRRNTSLRFALRVHESLHGPLSRDEWAAARSAMANEAHRDRIDAEPVSA